MDALILSADLADVSPESSSIPSEWFLSGQPETRSKLLGKTRDRLAYIMLWECGAVSFKWHYARDEVFVVLSGEAFQKDEKGGERRFGPGDVVFFPAGSEVTWRIPDHVRKVAVLKDPLWQPFAFALKGLMKLVRMVGLSGDSGL